MNLESGDEEKNVIYAVLWEKMAQRLVYLIVTSLSRRNKLFKALNKAFLSQPLLKVCIFPQGCSSFQPKEENARKGQSKK